MSEAAAPALAVVMAISALRIAGVPDRNALLERSKLDLA